MLSVAILVFLLLVVLLLVWVMLRFRQLSIQQFFLVGVLTKERDELRAAEKRLSRQVARLERQIEFERLPAAVQSEVVAFVEAREADEKSAREEANRAGVEEYWTYVKTKHPRFFLPKTCACGGFMGEPVLHIKWYPSTSGGRMTPDHMRPDHPYLLGYRICGACKHSLELVGDQSDAEFRDRHKREFHERHGFWYEQTGFAWRGWGA